MLRNKIFKRILSLRACNVKLFLIRLLTGYLQFVEVSSHIDKHYGLFRSKLRFLVFNKTYFERFVRQYRVKVMRFISCSEVKNLKLFHHP